MRQSLAGVGTSNCINIAFILEAAQLNRELDGGLSCIRGPPHRPVVTGSLKRQPREACTVLDSACEGARSRLAVTGRPFPVRYFLACHFLSVLSAGGAVRERTRVIENGESHSIGYKSFTVRRRDRGGDQPNQLFASEVAELPFKVRTA